MHLYTVSKESHLGEVGLERPDADARAECACPASPSMPALLLDGSFGGVLNGEMEAVGGGGEPEGEAVLV